MPAPLFLYLVPYLYQFSAGENIIAEYALSNGAIWDGFSKHPSTKKASFAMPNFHFLCENFMQIFVGLK